MTDQQRTDQQQPDYRPRPNEKLGDYLRRLRQAASAAQSYPVTQDEVANLSASLGAPNSFTKGWLSLVESGKRYKKISSEKLKAVAHIYTNLLGTRISENWLLELVGYAPTIELPLLIREQDELVAEHLKRTDIRALVMYAGELAKLGQDKSIATLVSLARSLVQAATNEQKNEDLFSDPVQSEHIKMFMKRMGLE